MKVMLDDMREGLGCDLVCRNEDAFRCLLHSGLLRTVGFTFLYIDHDLGETSKNGYEALKTMFYDHKMFPESVYIISSNPVGIKNIQGLLIEQDYFNFNYDGRTFVKR